MNTVINIGIVGCARILPAHLRGLKELRDKGFDNWRIAALCARHIDDALMFRKRGEGPPPRPSVIIHQTRDPLNAPHMYVSDLHADVLPEVYSDWREMLNQANLDAVLVLTPVHLHHQVALACLRAKKHVLIEKPFAVSVRAGQKMIEAADQAGLELGVAENQRYSPSTRMSRWLLDQGTIGSLQMWLSGGMGARDWSPDVIVAKTPWRHNKFLAGGGPAVDGGVHLFDRVRYLCGQVEVISAMAPQFEPRRVIRDETGAVVEAVHNQVEDAYFAHLHFSNGAVGMVFGGVAGHGEPTALEGGTVIYGSKGCLKQGQVILDDGQRLDGQELFWRSADIALRERWFPREIQDGFALEWHDFLSAIETGEPMDASGSEGLQDLACALGMLESAALRAPVQVAEVLNGRVSAYQRDIDAYYGL